MKTQDVNQLTGLIADLDNQRVRLPLRGVECDFRVTGSIASVEMRQVFFQDSNKALNCTYLFPLPADAAVHGCRIVINDRVIEAKVQELGKARELYEKALEEGRRAGRVETVRPNLFELSLGNVQPGDTILVILNYFHEIDQVGSLSSLRVPFCPGIRYIPGRFLEGDERTAQVRDMLRVISPRIFPDDPDAAYLSVRGEIQGLDPRDLTSPSHCIRVETKGTNHVIDVAAGDGLVPDRDFVLRWREEQPVGNAGTAWTFKRDGADYVLARVKLPEDTHVQQRPAQRFYLLIDRSGSMAGIKWSKTVQAIQGFMQAMQPNDRLHLTLFSSNWTELFPLPRRRSELRSEEIVAQLGSFPPNGGTELLPALSEVLRLAGQGNVQETSILLITDGQVGNEDEILERLKRFPDLTVHVFGIDSAVNDAFLSSLAKQQRGASCLCTPDDNIAAMVTLLADRICRPALDSIRLVPAPRKVLGLPRKAFANETLSFSFKASTPAKNLRLQARRTDGGLVDFPVTVRPTDSPTPFLLWAKREMDELLSQGSLRRAVRLSELANLPCRATAFVAWDENEKKTAATLMVQQPNLVPAQWDFSVRSELLPPPTMIAHRLEADSDELMCRVACSFSTVPPSMEYAVRDSSLTLRDLSPLKCELGEKIICKIEAWATAEDSILREAWIYELVQQLHKHEKDRVLFGIVLLEFVAQRMGGRPDITRLVLKLHTPQPRKP